LPGGAAMFVTLGAIAAIMTALNGTMLVPSRLGLMLAKDRLAPQWLGVVNASTATPIRGLTLTLLACALLLISGQLLLALNIAVTALIGLYLIHSVIFLLLPKLNPSLSKEITLNMSPRLMKVAALVSALSMATMLAIQFTGDIGTLRNQTLRERIAGGTLTSLELMVAWGLVGLMLYQFARLSSGKKPEPDLDREEAHAD
jgi:amino acid transporter